MTFPVQYITNTHAHMTDIEFFAKLCAIESRLSVLEQMLLRLLVLMQEYRRLMGGT